MRRATNPPVRADELVAETFSRLLAGVGDAAKMGEHPAASGLAGAAHIEHPALQRLYEYWQRKKGGRRFPRRGDIDPLEIGFILGYLMLLDVLRDPLRFKVRLHGTAMVMRAGYDLTGRLLDELPISDYRSYVIARCEGLVATGEPAAIRSDRRLDRRTFSYEALWLPISENGADVSMLLCALIYDDERRSAATRVAPL